MLAIPQYEREKYLFTIFGVHAKVLEDRVDIRVLLRIEKNKNSFPFLQFRIFKKKNQQFREYLQEIRWNIK